MRALILLLVMSSCGAEPSPVAPEERVITDAKGRTVVRTLPVPSELRNVWPAAWEEEFQDQCHAVAIVEGCAMCPADAFA